MIGVVRRALSLLLDVALMIWSAIALPLYTFYTPHLWSITSAVGAVGVWGGLGAVRR